MVGVINWGELRRLMLLSTNRLECFNASYWDKRASDFNENMVHMDDLTRQQLDRLPLLPEYAVLDVGAGAGRITIPVAKRVTQVTALEPSETMLTLLKANAEKENINNIRCIHGSLEDLEVGYGVDSHELVIASFSLFMIDIEKALVAMHNIATKGVYLFLSASVWMDSEIQKIIYGGSVPMWSDYIYAYNILYDLGILANVEIWDYSSKQSFSDLNSAVSKFTDLYSAPSKKQIELREYLRRTLVEDDGKLWIIRKRKAAMIWWTKSE